MITRVLHVAAVIAVSFLAHAASAQKTLPAATIVVPAIPIKGAALGVSGLIGVPPIQASALPVDAPDGGIAGEDMAQADGAPAAASGPALSPEQLDDLRRDYNESSEADRELLRSYFKDMGIDIKKLLGGPDEDHAGVAQSLAQAVRSTEFTRTPKTVLAARSKIGFSADPRPPATDFAATAQWLQTQVLAGEWETLAAALRELSSADAIATYTQILQTINRSQRGDQGEKPDPGLLPEEVLAIADAAPEALSDWQVTILAGLLKDAATKYSTDPMMQLLDGNTRSFGRQDAAHRERTVKFLIAAGMALEAAAYFPPIDEARANLDARALFNYAKYHEELGASNRAGVDALQQQRIAWELYCEVALVESAEAELRQLAMSRAIDMLPSMPPAMSSNWLKRVFANAMLAPAALEIIALKAVSLRNSELELPQRVQTILTMKESVDTLLAQSGLDIRLLRVPLRMLTTALVGEAEVALGMGSGMGGAGGNQSRRGRQGGAGSQEKELLLKAMPDAKWMGVLEPSLASRVYRAAIGIATSADEIDVAIDYLADAVDRFPLQGPELADNFLNQWVSRLGPQGQFDTGDDWQYIGFGPGGITSAPLTRGRQRRNLDRLARIMLILDEIGVDPARLPSVAATFGACHGQTEVFRRDGITEIFGPLDGIAPEIAARLADRMRSGLSGEWRDRRAQQAAGMKRSADEITQMVDEGYALAIELINIAIAQKPDSWNYAVTKAGLTYDRVQYAQEQKKQDFAVYNQYRKEAFEAFAQTANRYAEVVSSGDQRDDPSVFLAWFSAAVGATELNYLTPEDLLVEGSPQDDQIDLIRKAIAQLPAEIAQRHIGAFAHAISNALATMQPDVKPRVVRHAMRIIGDHPSGASLRRLTDLYRDLMKDEIKLRLAIDGDDRVGTNSRFGVTLLLRFTAEVDRETGGFSRYLQNDVWARVGNSYRPMNYRDLLKKSLDSAFGDSFEIESIGFFEALAPAKPVSESGAKGWLEKPVAYIVAKAKDASVDRIPAVSMDMHFNDTAGPVVLPITSNSPPIDAAKSSGPRPMRNLAVIETVDLRDIENSQKNRPVIFEVHATAEGIIPDLKDLLPGLSSALAGYELKESNLEVRPITLIEPDGNASAIRSMYSYGGQPKQLDYAASDESGTYRLQTERSWLATFTPSSGGVGNDFVFPTLASGLEGKVTLREFADMDIVTLSTTHARVPSTPWSLRNFLLGGGVVAIVVVAATLLRRRKVVPVETKSSMPTKVTPLSVITALRRVSHERAESLSTSDRQAIAAHIRELEETYFGRRAVGDAPLNGEADSALHSALARWI